MRWRVYSGSTFGTKLPEISIAGMGMASEQGPEETVLLVSDDASLLVVAKAALESQGCRVLLAWNAERALWLLGRLQVQRVVVREGMAEAETVQTGCRAKGLHVEWLRGGVDGEIVRVTVPSREDRPPRKQHVLRASGLLH
jgi:hypothetical protein